MEQEQAQNADEMRISGAGEVGDNGRGGGVVGETGG